MGMATIDVFIKGFIYTPPTISSMDAKPHVCFISTTVYAYLSDEPIELAGGAERQQYLLGKELKERGYKISYITGVFDTRAKSKIEGFDVYQSLPLDSGVTGAPLKMWRLFQSMTDCDADIYYVRGNPFHCILAAHMCKLLGKQFVYSIANDAQVDQERLKRDTSYFYRRLYIRSIRMASEVATLTTHQKDLLKQNHNIDATWIPVGYDVPPTDKIVPHSQREYIFWAGRIVEYNKPNAFIDLAREFPETKFVMAGPSELDSDFTIMGEPTFEEKTIKAAQEVQNLEYIGFVPPDEIHEYFKNAISYIQTTDAIADIGNTTLEAWRYATPIISLYTNYDGKIESNELGLYSAGSFQQLIKNTSTLLESSDLQAKLGYNGRDHLKKHFSLAHITDKYESLFSQS